jgi:hypothetical protein
VEAAEVYGFSEMLKFLAKQIFSKKKILRRKISKLQEYYNCGNEKFRINYLIIGQTCVEVIMIYDFSCVSGPIPSMKCPDCCNRSLLPETMGVLTDIDIHSCTKLIEFTGTPSPNRKKPITVKLD